MVNQIVVAGAVVADSRLLIAQRNRPPELAGRWELPGGKVDAGESDVEALARELAEELGVDVAVGEHLADVALSESTTLRAYAAELVGGTPHPHDHAALRWVSAADVDSVDWVPADRGFLPALRRLLAT